MAGDRVVRLVASDDFAEAKDHFERLVSSLAPEVHTASWFASGHGPCRETLRDGGWLTCGGVGRREESIVNLLELAQVWGRFLIPLPFSLSVVLTRWAPLDIDVVSDCGDFLTLAIGRRGGPAVVPFGGTAGVTWLDSVDTGAPAAAGETVDDFAASMPVLRTTRASEAPEQCRQEVMAVLVAEAVGAARRCLEMSIRYTDDRRAYGRPIGTFQAIRHRAADMYRDLEMAQSALLWCALAPSLGEALRAARVSGALSRAVIEGAVQLYGGVGFTWDLGLHWFLRHVLTVERIVRMASSG
jgi:hypothetical protein